MSGKCDKEECVLRLERIAASAKILANQIRRNDWHQNVLPAARQIAADASTVCGQVEGDTAWAAQDR